MSTTHPEQIAIDVDRAALASYLRRLWLALCLTLMIPGALFGVIWASEHLKNTTFFSGSRVALYASCVGQGIAYGALTGLVLYVVRGHRSAARRAQGLHIRVEGPFLRIISNDSTLFDRKLHFRSILGYSVIQDRLMRRCGIHALRLTTIGSGVNGSIDLNGVKNAFEVRDLLAELDRQRENL